MSEGARVESIDALRNFKRALQKFAEAASVALGDAESEIQRTQIWLETEQRSHWNNQARIRGVGWDADRRIGPWYTVSRCIRGNDG